MSNGFGNEGERGLLKLDPEQLAQSAFRVWQSITGGNASWVGQRPGLDLMPADVQEGWARIGSYAEGLLARLAAEGGGSRAGVSYREAGYHVMTLSLDRDRRKIARDLWNQAMGEQAQLAWEAVARHLAMVLNSDELGSLEEAEAIWPMWVTSRVTAKAA